MRGSLVELEVLGGVLGLEELQEALLVDVVGHDVAEGRRVVRAPVERLQAEHHLAVRAHRAGHKTLKSSGKSFRCWVSMSRRDRTILDRLMKPTLKENENIFELRRL